MFSAGFESASTRGGGQQSTYDRCTTKASQMANLSGSMVEKGVASSFLTVEWECSVFSTELISQLNQAGANPLQFSLF